MSSRERIRQIIEIWFLREPLLFAAWTTHSLVLETRIQTIRVRRGCIEYNPDFIDSLDHRQLEAVLRFEAMRILLKHPYQRRKENAQFAYTASNLTLQEYLRTTLPFPLARDFFGTNEFDRQYFEFYYYKLIELADQEASDALDNEDSDSDDGQGQGQSSTESSSSPGGGTADDQSPPSGPTSSDSQSEPPETNQEEAEKPNDQEQPDPTQEKSPEQEPSQSERSPLDDYIDAETSGQENTEEWDEDEFLTDRINEQIRNAHESNQWGSVKGRLQERVLATLRPKLDYRSVLRQFRTTVLSVNRVLTRMKPSRRYGFLYMGSRRDFTTNLLFAVDVSGSISSEDLARGFSVINQYFKYGIESIDVIQFDTEIKGKPQTLKRARRQLDIIGRGGTSFVPVMNYIDEHRHYDGLIVFTDGYAPIPPLPKNRKTRILWLFNKESSYQEMHKGLRPLGRSIFLKDD